MTEQNRQGADAPMALAELLVHGPLTSQPEERIDRNGKPYTVAHMLAVADENKRFPLSIVSHAPSVSLTLQTHEPGDVVSISGRLALHTNADGSTHLGIRARRMLSIHPTVRLKS